MKRKAAIIISTALVLALFITSILTTTGCGARKGDQAETPAPPAAAPEPEPPLPDVENEPYLLIPFDGVIPEPDPLRHPFTDKEIEILAKVLYRETQVISWRGEQYGVSAKARQAAVAWCALNRYDAGTFGDTLEKVLTTPYQFAYYEDTPVTDYMLELAVDVVERWYHESLGGQNVGRTLPRGYLFFEGDGRENYFRKVYTGDYTVWDWSLEDPYREESNQ